MEKGLTERMILDLKNEIGNHKNFMNLGVELDISMEDMIDYEKKNKKNTSEGIAAMLIAWRKKTPEKKQIPKMKAALRKTGLADEAKSFFAGR